MQKSCTAIPIAFESSYGYDSVEVVVCVLLPAVQLSGQLPESFKSLSHLQTLVLNNNNLSLTVPPAWSDLKALQSVYLYNNSDLKGCLPASWESQLHADFDVGYYLLEGTGLTGFCTTS